MPHPTLEQMYAPEDFRSWVALAFMYAQGEAANLFGWEDVLDGHVENTGRWEILYDRHVPFEAVLQRFCATIFLNNDREADYSTPLVFETRIGLWRLAYRMYERWFELHPAQQNGIVDTTQTAHCEHFQGEARCK